MTTNTPSGADRIREIKEALRREQEATAAVKPNLDAIPAELKAVPRWLVWKYTRNPKTDKLDKVPYNATTGAVCDVTDPQNWTTFEKAAEVSKRYSGVGLAFNGDGLVGIDLDDCRNAETGELTTAAQWIIDRLGTYCEVSPSKRGVKLFLRGELPKGRHKDDERGFEVYGSGRYFTTTGWQVEGTPGTLKDCNGELPDVLAFMFPPRTPKHSEADTRELAVQALHALRPERADSYSDWLAVGMSLHSIDHGLLAEWDQWSRQSAKYQEGVCARKWEGFTSGQGRIGAGSLFFMAKEDGWAFPHRQQKPSSRPVSGSITNITFELDGDREQVRPLPMEDVKGSILQLTDNWPRRVTRSLFIPDDTAGVFWLDSPGALFGWLESRFGIVDWRKITGCVSQERVYAEFCRTADQYECVEILPHEPRIPNHYYACEFPQPGDGSTVGKLLDFFVPETPLDRELMLAAYATGLWGGSPGKRPAFMFTASGGRGKGKTRAAMFLARVFGGFYDISANENMEIIKQRLLTAESTTTRFCLLDNVKTARFSWSALEALITSVTVSGKALYRGEASRPNYLVWLITLNGASLSTDLAQRVVEIRLGEPTYCPTWETNVERFIDAHQTAIIGDLTGFLRRDPKTLKTRSRWAGWEADVLSRVDHPDQCLDLILERRGQVDVEQEEGEILEDHFASKLEWLGYAVDRADVFIPNSYATRWYNEAMNDKAKTTAVTRNLKQLCNEGRLWRISYYRVGGSGERGWRWVGEHADAAADTQFDIRRRMAKKLEQKQEQKQDF